MSRREDLGYAEARYMRERPRFHTSYECLAYIISVCRLIPESRIRTAAEGKGWEERYLKITQQRFEQKPTKDKVDMVREDAKPEDVLGKLIMGERAAYEAFEYQCEVLQEDPGNAEHARAYSEAFKSWKLAADERQNYADIVRRQALEIDQTPAWQARHKRIVEELRLQYQGQGIQYDLVIDATADAAVQLERLRESERQATPKEVEIWHKNLLACVRRLQMYTESAKVETTTKMLNEVMNDVLIELERIIKPNQPALWQMCTLAVERYISQRRALAS